MLLELVLHRQLEKQIERQKSLREVVFAELPAVGDTVQQNEPYGTVESVKAVVDLIAPVSGTVKEVDEKLLDDATPINEDPYGEGWLITITPSDLANELKNLLDFNAAVEFYKNLVKE